MAAMLNVLNKRWLTLGWHVMDKRDAEPMALAFIEVLDRDGIPWQRYAELYHRSLELRSNRLAQGLRCEDFSAEMMTACWPELLRKLHEDRVKEGRYLADTAASDCPRCLGTGCEIVYSPEGKKLGARPTCDHRILVEGEWLFTEVK